MRSVRAYWFLMAGTLAGCGLLGRRDAVPYPVAQIAGCYVLAPRDSGLSPQFPDTFALTTNWDKNNVDGWVATWRVTSGRRPWDTGYTFSYRVFGDSVEMVQHAPFHALILAARRNGAVLEGTLSQNAGGAWRDWHLKAERRTCMGFREPPNKRL
jgi:hypothetical protein